MVINSSFMVLNSDQWTPDVELGSNCLTCHAILSRFKVSSSVLAPCRAEARAASQPACPPPTTTTSYSSSSLAQFDASARLLKLACSRPDVLAPCRRSTGTGGKLAARPQRRQGTDNAVVDRENLGPRPSGAAQRGAARADAQLCMGCR